MQEFIPLIVACSLVLAGCNYSLEKKNSPAAAADLNAPAGQVVLNFDLMEKQVFAPHCFECHSLARRNISPNLETFDNVKSNLSRIESAVSTDFMPLDRPAVPAPQKQLLAQWIALGAPQ